MGNKCKKKRNFVWEIKWGVSENAVEALALPTAGDGIAYNPNLFEDSSIAKFIPLI